MMNRRTTTGQSATLRSVALPLVLVFTLLTGTLPAPGCGQGDDKARNIALARDVVNSLEAALPLVRELKPKAGELLARGIPIANRIVSAIEASDAEGAAGLLRDLLPIITDVAEQFTGNTKVLTILALANIALHLLINHMAPKLAKDAKSRGVDVSVIEKFKAERVWGCDYRPDLCPTN